MTTGDDFTKAEGTASASESAKVMLRLLLSLKLLQWMFIPSIICIIFAAVLPQFALWLMGQFSRCQDVSPSCPASLPWLESYSLDVNLTLIFIIVVVAIAVRTLGWLVFELSGQWSAQDIHRNCVHALSKVRVTFFDENPSGRLINRLIRDFDNLRLAAVSRFGDILNALGDIFAAALFVSIAEPLVLILLIPTLSIFAFIQYNIALMIHRLGFLYSAARGQFLHRETDVLEGFRQYRLFDAQAALFARVKDSARKFVEINFLRSKIEAWGRFWVSTGTSTFIVGSLIALSFAVSYSNFDRALAAVLVTVLFRVTPAFTMLMWVSSFSIESVAVCQRVFGIVDLQEESSEEGLSQNRKQEVTDKLLSGDIEFKEFSMSYREDSPPILQNFSLLLEHSRRIGIIGRTGAGKSSILQSLFRMVYRRSGDISIGGESIYDYSPEFIRSHFAVVPQDSYLFKGTLRSNLDPKQEFIDAQLEEAMRKVGMSFSLDIEIQEEGGNLSAGERQLLCLARALLLDRPVFVLDEPTSGLDSITDAAIQRLLETELRGKTVIAIAHRLETLKGYDTIFELDESGVRKV